jgi:predicted O-methyltransferase YrrM
MEPAAVLFLIFNRPDTTALVMEAIRAAQPPRLYIAADGPRGRPGEAVLCEQARCIAAHIDWPCEVRTLFRDQNLGCRQAPISAIDWFLANEEEGIILEDDCLPSQDFFRFCSELLERFRNDNRVMAICGSSYADLGSRYSASYYFAYYADPWGWATWRRAWRLYDRNLSRWPEFKARSGLETVSRGRRWHEAYWAGVFDATREGRINYVWDYQWIYSVIEQGGLACYPVRNLISNLGFRADATHTIFKDGIDPLPRVAALPHEKLTFPLSHPGHTRRLMTAERQIEELRLGLTSPTLGTKLKRATRWLLGEEAIGMLDYYRHPERGQMWGGPFNGQAARQALFHEIVSKLHPRAIVETGTYLGTTAEFMAQTGLPVYTVEGNCRNYGFARVRLRRRQNVILLRGDSREALHRLFDGPLRQLADSTIFFYLDAHWNADLPLIEELETVFSRCPAAIAVIDDFEVPFDPGYGYDDYGPGKALTASLIAPLVSRYQLQIYYPSTHSAIESGLRRGCAVLAKEAIHGKALALISLLCLVERPGSPEATSSRSSKLL